MTDVAIVRSSVALNTFVTVEVDVVAAMCAVAEGGVAMCTMGVDDDAVGAVAVKIAAVFMLSCVEKADVSYVVWNAVASDAVAVGAVVSSDVAEKAVAAVNWC